MKSGERKRVLFVDDEASLRSTLPAILRQHGFEVMAVGTVADAIGAMSREPFDVLLSDLNIGEPGDGFTVVSAMRRTQPNARSFILTGYPDFDSALRAIRNQVDDYFVKPADLDTLVATLQQSLDSPAHTPYGPLKQVSQVLQEVAAEIGRNFVQQARAARELAGVTCSDDELARHVPALVQELAWRVRSGADELRSESFQSAAEYGGGRRDHGYTIAMLVCESHLLEHVISRCLHDNMLRLDMSRL
ncbi:MAG TPA: response regulator, partial [Terriglobales bacterium]|nr:response regulator [Terriglobales bacterium]